nr:hypothetical protein [Tanacetum cinerariifolium]
SYTMERPILYAYLTTAVVTSRGGRILCQLVRQDRSHQDQEEHQASKGSLCVTTEEELEFLADPGTAESSSNQTIITNNNSTLPVLQDDLILSVIEQLKTQVVTCTKINQDNKHINDLLTAELERYRSQERVLNELKHDEKSSTSYESSQEIESIKHTLSEHLKENESLEQNITILKNDFQEEESRNIDRELALEKHVKELNNIVFKRSQSAQTVHMLTKPQVFYNHSTRQALETLMLAKESHSKMIKKQKDPKTTEKKVIIKPINYDILNQLSTDFKTRFVPQIKLYAKQDFWSKYSVQTDEPNLSATTTIVEVPKELPKVSMELFTSFYQYLIDEVTEVQHVFKQMELTVEQNCEEKHNFQNKMEHVLQENDRLLTQALSVEIVNVVVHDNVMSDCLNVDVCAHCKNTLSSSESAPTFAEFFKLNELKAQAQAKDTVILQLKEKLRSLKGDVTEISVKREVEEIETLNIELDHKKKVLVITALKEQLSKLKGKAVLTKAVSLNPIDPEFLKVDVAPLVPKLRKNRTAHIDYIRHTLDKAAILREIVESERLLCPLNTSLDYA